MHLVEIEKERPDFRVFIDLLYGHDRNVDTDGNSIPVHSRIWTELYISDRESNDPSVEISLSVDQPKVFVVESESDRLEELAALYLFLTSGTSISNSSTRLSAEQILELQRRYAPDLARAANSIWHKSSHGVPYPNLA